MIGSGIAKGMATTLKHFFGKKYTIQYPEERAPLPVGFRGLPRLLYDDEPTNFRCVACRICENACPVDVIHIDTHRGEDRKMVLDRFDLEAGGCVFCGFCVEACPFEALTMMHGFELAAYDREQLLWTKEMLAINATPRTLADMERIHGPKEKEEKKEAPATAPAKNLGAAVPANAAGEPSAAIPAATPESAEVTVAVEGNGQESEPDAPPDAASEAPGPSPAARA